MHACPNNKALMERTLHSSLLSATRVYTRVHPVLRACFSGLLIACGFAPMHLPGFTILGLALLFLQLHQASSRKVAFVAGFWSGLSTMAIGVSWIYVSIHLYGHLHPLLSAGLTLIFLMYLALFPGLMALVYHTLRDQQSVWKACGLFSALWMLSEYARAHFLGGFPWLMVGVSQMDTPLRHLFPLIGLYGVGFFTCLASAFLAMGLSTRRQLGVMLSVGLILLPLSLSSLSWASFDKQPLSVGIIQANISMQDKWNSSFFWTLMQQYHQSINELIEHTALIVLPESAIPVPADYIHDVLDTLDREAKHVNHAILLGIPQKAEKTDYYNTMLSLGQAQGSYFKQHLVPFGEFIPDPFQHWMDFLGIPAPNLQSHPAPQDWITVNHHKMASLICYELAYPELIRQQLPQAQWIVSISDGGWFGHSFAIYQMLQMAQVLAISTARFHVVANNGGLSSVIDAHGQILSSLPAFQAGILQANIHPGIGATPWVRWGDWPSLSLCLLLIGVALLRFLNSCFNVKNKSAAQ